MSDTYRALAAPRKTLVTNRAFIEGATQFDFACAPMTNTQIAALWQARLAGGLLASMGVGSGKGLISLLLAAVMNRLKPVIVVKTNLVANLMNEYQKWRAHYDIRDFVVFTYDALSIEKNARLLYEADVDLIICDEAHLLKNPVAARTNRVLTKFVKDRPAGAMLTGTLTTRSVADYAHTAEAALRDASPIPQFDDVSCGAWRRVMGYKPDPQQYDWHHVRPLCVRYGCPETTEGARAALREHLDTTSGVILTTEASCGASIYITKVTEPKPPAEINDLIDQALDEQRDPDGKRISIFEADIIARQLQYGFWYRRTPIATPLPWPSLEQHPIDEVVEKWRSAASAWGRAVRAWMAEGGEVGCDSPALARAAARRGELGQYAHDVLTKFEEVEHTVRWVRETVWLWDGFIEAQRAWLNECSEPAILWFRHKAVADRIQGWPVYAAGAKLPYIDGRVPAHTCLASVQAMNQGHNLQAWRVMRFAQMPSDAGVVQQCFGRVHRLGQEADEIEVSIVAHSKFAKKSLDNAKRAAEYVEQTTGERQRLLLATWV